MEGQERGPPSEEQRQHQPQDEAEPEGGASPPGEAEGAARPQERGQDAEGVDENPGRHGHNPPPKSSGINRPQREQMERERKQREQKRAQQKRAREERSQLRRELAARRQREAELIQERVREQALAAEAMLREEREEALNVGSSSDTTDSGDDIEDLPGEVEFLRHFKMVRDRTPDREELMAQRHGDAQDSINEVLNDLHKIGDALLEGKLPVGEQVTEFFETYQSIWNRITHLCHTQGHYARLRDLQRARILIELDTEIKQSAEEVLMLYQDKRRALKEHRAQRRQERQNNQRQQPQDAGPRPNNGFRTQRRTQLDGFLNSLSAPGRQATHNREYRIHSAPASLEDSDGANPEPEGANNSPVTISRIFLSRARNRNNGDKQRAEPRSSGEQGGTNGTSSSTNLTNSALARGGASGSGGYVPHYLQPGAEGAMFYGTLPDHWNITPEHVPTPVTQIPSMQKAGFFPDFTGEVQNYRTFRAAFIDLCHKLDIPISTKYLILRQSLNKHGVLTDLLNTTTPNAAGYRTVILTLEERYGHTDVLLAHHLQRLNEMPRVRETQIEDFELLADLVRGYEAARSTNGNNNPQDPTFYNVVKSKLTDRMRREYARYSTEQGIPQGSCDVNELLRWIKTHIADPLRREPPTKRTDTTNKKTTMSNNNGKSTSLNGFQTQGSGHQPGPMQLEKSNKYQFYSGHECKLCRSSHNLHECPEFLGYPLSKRFDLVKQLNICYKCLNGSHMASECKANPCSKCKNAHHTVLHYQRKQNPTKTKNVKFAAPTTRSYPESDPQDYMYTTEEFLDHARQNSSNKEFTNYLCMLRGDPPVSLFFQWVTVVNPQSGKQSRCNLMQDPGAQFTVISTRLGRELRLQGATRSSTVVGVGGHVATTQTLFANLVLISNNGLLRKTLNVRTMDNPVGNLRAVDWNLLKHYWPHLADVQFPRPVNGGQVDMILGMDYPQLTTPLLQRRAPLSNQAEPSPVGVYNVLGWTAAGPMLPRNCTPSHTDHPRPGRVPSLHAHAASQANEPEVHIPEELEALLHFLPGANRPPGVLLNPDERATMLKLYSETKMLPNGHYQSPVLWKGDRRPPNNRHAALSEWNRNLTRLKDAQLHHEFDKIIQHWIESDYVERLPDQAVQDKKAFYLPYFAVLRPDKPSSPVRIVMNGKAVFGPDKISLNDCLDKGPRLINDLVEVLLRFRQQPIGIACDIKEMFLNIYMPPEDRDYHRFFYTKPQEQQAGVYRANVHQFGSSSSPNSSIFPLKLQALRKAATHALASRAIIDKSIVDDTLTPALNPELGVKTVSEIIDIAASMGMKVHKWASNDPSILPKDTPQRELVELSSPDLEGQYPEGKALGIIWHTRTDEMSFAPLKPVVANKWTKRVALACLMSFYSPDGLGLPIEMTGRFLFRQTWELGTDWDQELTPAFVRKWKAWEQQMGHLGHIKYPRSVGTTFQQMHIFCDASGSGYGAAAYLKTDLGVHLVYSKGKLVKSISQTIPVLELEACVVGFKMVPKLLKVYGLPPEEVYCWTDSGNAENWIKNPARDLPRPIARRVTMIRENSIIANWRHVPTDMNPADILSRGCKALNLANNTLWVERPASSSKQELGLQIWSNPSHMLRYLTRQHWLDWSEYSQYWTRTQNRHDAHCSRSPTSDEVVEYYTGYTGS